MGAALSLVLDVVVEACVLMSEVIVHLAIGIGTVLDGLGAGALSGSTVLGGSAVGSTIAEVASFATVPMRRDEGILAELNATQIKCVYRPYDVALDHPLIVGQFSVTELDHNNGTATFVWRNYTSQPGTLTNMWLDDNRNLIFPDQNDDGTYPWYPNGTLDGTDAVGHPIYGTWTTDLSEKDHIALEHLHAKRRHVQEFQAKYPGRPLPYFHVKFSPLDELPPNRLHGHIWGFVTRNRKRTEEEQAWDDYHAIEKRDVTYGGDMAMFQAVHDALVYSVREQGL